MRQDDQPSSERIQRLIDELITLYGELATAVRRAEKATPGSEAASVRLSVYERIVPRQHELGELLASRRDEAEHDRDPHLIEDPARSTP